MVSYILAVITGVFALLADQFTKVYVSNNLVLNKSYEFLPGILDIFYINNDGGAWGVLGGYTWLLISITAVIMLVCVTLLLKYGIKDKLLFWSIMLVLSGGVGNMIDRIFRGGEVIDFLHFEFWPTFPVFNVADCAIVLGAGLMIFYFIKGIIDEGIQNQKALAQTLQQQEESNENADI